MGLDITVRRLVKAPKKEYDYFRMTDNNGNYSNNGFPDWTKGFETEITEDWYDWEAYKEQTGIDIKDFEWDGVFDSEEDCFMVVHPKDKALPKYTVDYPGGYEAYKEELDKIQIKIDLEKVPTKPVSVKVINFNEVGYQRSGLNQKFYSDYEDGKIGYFVWTKEELERYKNEYCERKTGDTVFPKQNFQENIIDKFEEGKDCVTFSW